MTRRHSRDDPREDVCEDVDVGVGPMEFQLYTTACTTVQALTTTDSTART